MWYDGIEEKVVAAYKENGLQPAPFDAIPAPGTRRCCAVGAMFYGKLNRGREVLEAANYLGVDSEEVWAYVYGFDAAIDGTTLPSEGPRGAGIRTALAVMAAGL